MKFILAEDLFKDCITAKTGAKVKCIWAHNGNIFLTGESDASVGSKYDIGKLCLMSSDSLSTSLRLLNYPIIFQA